MLFLERPEVIMTKRSTFPALLLLLNVSACGGGGGNLAPTGPPDLLSVLKERPSLTLFTEAFESTGVADQLELDGAYTVFVPIDQSVAGSLDVATIRHHIISDRIGFSDIAGENEIYTTLNDDEIEIDATDQIAIGSGFMIESDINASNGVIHVIDQVLEASGEAPAILSAPIGNRVRPTNPNNDAR